MIKMSKKTKILLDKLGLPSNKVILEKDLVKNTVKEIKSETPRMACVRANFSFSWNVGGEDLQFHKGREYIMAVGTFLEHRKSDEHNVIFDPASTKFKDVFKRYNGQNLDYKALLIWRFGGIGDLMFAQPLIKYLKSTYPTCKIFFATAPKNTTLFRSWPSGLVDKPLAMPFEKDIMRECDYHLTFEGSIERCKEAHTTSAFDIFKKMAGVEFDINDYPTELILDDALTSAIRPFIPPNTVAIQLRASSQLRNLPIPNVVRIAKKLVERGYLPGIIDLSREAENVDVFVKNLNNAGIKAINLARYSESLQHCLSILKCCIGAIATDSSITHLTPAIGKPVLGLYGPFTGDVRMSYYKTGDWIDGSKNWNECKKAPCYFHDNDIRNCPYLSSKHPPGCLMQLKEDEVVEKFELLLDKLEVSKPDAPVTDIS